MCALPAGGGSGCKEGEESDVEGVIVSTKNAQISRF